MFVCLFPNKPSLFLKMEKTPEEGLTSMLLGGYSNFFNHCHYSLLEKRKKERKKSQNQETIGTRLVFYLVVE